MRQYRVPSLPRRAVWKPIRRTAAFAQIRTTNLDDDKRRGWPNRFILFCTRSPIGIMPRRAWSANSNSPIEQIKYQPMEVLLEILFEIIAQIVGVIIEGLFYALSDRYMSNTQAKRRAKYIIGALILTGVIALTVYGLIIKRGPIVIASLSYILSLSIIRGALFFNGQGGKKWIKQLFGWLARILHYGFAIILIVLTAIYVDGPVAKPLIISLSALSIVIFSLIDMHKLRTWDKEQGEGELSFTDQSNDVKDRLDD